MEIEPKKLIRNIKLSILTDNNLDINHIQSHNFLINLFKNLNKYAYDEHKWIFYGRSPNSIIFKYDYEYNIIYIDDVIWRKVYGDIGKDYDYESELFKYYIEHAYDLKNVKIYNQDIKHLISFLKAHYNRVLKELKYHSQTVSI